MLAITLTFILAIVISFIVTLDATRANLYIGTATLSGIPQFFIVFVSIITGVFLASFTTIKNLIESKLTIFGQKSDLKKSYKEADNLQLAVNKLEKENLALKEQIKENTHSN